MRIAFAGNPNSGKTTMYNALTGRNEHVGNWAGVTVDKKEAPIKKTYAGDRELIAVDLPGAYSMSPFTSEESVTSTYVKNENPDAIINIVDATNLSRSLFFTTQLLELGIPMVVALNKADINEKKETVIDTAALSKKLGCPVVETVSTSHGHEGLAEVVRAAVAAIGKPQKAPYTQGDIDLTSREAVAAADRKRFAFVNKIVSSVETVSTTGQPRAEARASTSMVVFFFRVRSDLFRATTTGMPSSSSWVVKNRERLRFVASTILMMASGFSFTT